MNKIFQPNWYIDSVNGNDDFDGLTPATALKSHRELEERWTDAVLMNTITVNVLSSLNETIRLRNVRIADGGGTNPFDLRYIAHPTVAYSGSLTSASAMIVGTTYPVINDESIASFAPFVNQRVRISSGPRMGMTSWIAETLADPETASTSVWFQIDPTGSNPAINPAIVTPVAGDAFVIETLPTVKGFDMDVTRLSLGTGNDFNHVIVDSFECVTSPETAVVFHSNTRHASPYFSRCKFGAHRSIQVETGYFVNCHFATSGVTSFTGNAVVVGGMSNYFLGIANARLTLSQHFRFHAIIAGASVSSDCVIASSQGGFAFTKCNTANLISVGSKGYLQMLGSAVIWGYNNSSTIPVKVDAGGLFTYVNAKPMLSGSTVGNDCSVGGDIKSWADIPYTHPTKLCGIVQL
jgi:hypothetical protein